MGVSASPVVHFEASVLDTVDRQAALPGVQIGPEQNSVIQVAKLVVH